MRKKFFGVKICPEKKFLGYFSKYIPENSFGTGVLKVCSVFGLSFRVLELCRISCQFAAVRWWCGVVWFLPLARPSVCQSAVVRSGMPCKLHFCLLTGFSCFSGLSLVCNPASPYSSILGLVWCLTSKGIPCLVFLSMFCLSCLPLWACILPCMGFSVSCRDSVRLSGSRLYLRLFRRSGIGKKSPCPWWAVCRSPHGVKVYQIANCLSSAFRAPVMVL